MARMNGWVDCDGDTIELRESEDNDGNDSLLIVVNNDESWSLNPDDARDIAAALLKWAKSK